MSRHITARLSLSGLLLAAAAATSVAATCDVRLIVDLAPDAPAPADPVFLSSLLSAQPGYRLTLVGRTPDSQAILDLNGPGSASQCQDAIETIRRDARVLLVSRETKADKSSVDQESDGETEEPPGVRVSRAGLGAVFRALGHPEHALDILLPVRPDKSRHAYEDAVAELDSECLAHLSPMSEAPDCATTKSQNPPLP